LPYEFSVPERDFVKRKINRIGGGGPQGRRKSVAQILRASYERFATDKETLLALKAVLGQRVKARS
jgi:hypothetical protein